MKKYARCLEYHTNRARPGKPKTVSLLISVLLFLFLGMQGCRSVHSFGKNPVPLTEVTREKIEQSILEGNPFDAFQDLDLLKRKGTEIPVSQLKALRQDASKALQSLFEKSIAEGNYERALSAYRSALSLSMGDEYDGWTQSRILSESALALLEKEEYVAAYLTYSKAIKSGEVDEESARRFLESAIENGYTPLVRSITDAELVSDAPSVELNSSIAPENLLQGTVTILVNRGIRMDRGVGYPDSVIGSGFFVDPRGYILTNYHIIESEVNPRYEGFSRLYIRPHNRENLKVPAKVIGWDPVFDIALLKAEIETGYVYSVDADIDYSPGDTIYAIGSPGGLRNTVTSGIVSATGRRFLQMGTTLQVDVPVNPGNSGGPLVNSDGELIGVVFAGIEQFEGINFAIPTQWIVHALPELFSGGAAVHSWLGLTVEETVRGLEVSYVLPGEAAGRAGIEVGDIVTSIYGSDVETVEQVHEITVDLAPDTLIEMTWRRDGKRNSGIVSLGQRPEYPFDVAREKDVFTNLVAPLYGMSIEKAGNYFWEPTYEIRRIYSGGIADETGLSVNDPLTIVGFEVDEENRVGFLQIVVRKKKAGFVERAIQLGTYLEIDNFI